MTQHSEGAARKRFNRAWLWGIVAVVVVASALVYAAVVGGAFGTSAGPATETPAASSSPDPTAPSTPTGTPKPGATVSPAPSATSDAMPELTPVAPDRPSDNGKGLVADISQMKAVEGEAVQAGEISGPAVQFTLVLTNDTDAPVDLGLISVNAYIGADRTPAGGLVKPGGDPFEGALAVGKTAKGVYVFTIPKGQRGDVTLTVDYRAGQPAFVFRGAVG